MSVVSRVASSFVEVPVEPLQSYFEHREGRDNVLLTLLQLLRLRNVTILSTPARGQTNFNQRLGDGATGQIELREIPFILQIAYNRFQNAETCWQLQQDAFIDHVGRKWSLNTRMALKMMTGSRSLEHSLECVIREVAVLTHKRLAKHPNIAKLIAVSWAPFRGSDAGIITQPTIILERARTDLWSFIKQRRSGKVLSFDVKMRLVMDILNGLQALHECDIVHCDLKCENVLLYSSEHLGNRENYVAQLADFSGCLCLYEDSPGRYFTRDLTFTRLYAPPELLAHKNEVDALDARGIDVWAIGMLLWQVMIDGKLQEYYGCATTADLENLIHHEATQYDHQLSDKAVEMIARHLNSTQPGLPPAQMILVRQFLTGTLKRQPSKRTTISHLRTLIKSYTESTIEELQSSQAFSNGSPFDGTVPGSLQPFDICQQWNVLAMHHDLETQVWEQMEDALKVAHHDAHITDAFRFQLALAYCTGIRSEVRARNREVGLNLLTELAAKGHPQSRALIVRISCNSSQRGILEHSEVEAVRYLTEGLLNGSRIAREDLYHHFGDHYLEAQSSLSNSLLRSARHISFLTACQIGAFEIAIQEIKKSSCDINQRGKMGETAVHWLINIMDDEQTLAVLEQIGKMDGDLEVLADAPQLYYGSDPAVDSAGQHTTALDWAIAADRTILAQRLFEMISQRGRSPFSHHRNPIVWAVRHQSLKCLKWLCQIMHNRSTISIQPDLSTPVPDQSWGVNTCDQWMNYPLFYAIRQNQLARLVRTSYPLLVIDDGQVALPDLNSGIGSYHRTNLAVIDTLLENGADIQVSTVAFHKFNALHQAAATSPPEVVSHLLKKAPNRNSLLLENSVWKQPKAILAAGGEAATPLGTAVSYLRLQNMQLLIDAGSNPYIVWPSHKATSLHLLGLSIARPEVLEIAQELLRRHPDMLYKRDKDRSIPVHRAAASGNSSLTRLLLENMMQKPQIHGWFWRDSSSSALLSTNKYRLTTLAYAIVSRDVATVREVLQFCEKTNTPTLAVPSPTACSGIRFLLAPGNWSSDAVIRMGVECQIGWGTLDLPFSVASENILNELLITRERMHDQPNKIVSFLSLARQQRNWKVDCETNWAILNAISVGNIIVVKKLCASVPKDILDHGLLLYHAFCQLWLSDSAHHATRQDRQQVLHHLRKCSRDAWEERKAARISRHTVIGVFWLFYYWTYGNINKEQEDRFHDWQEKNWEHLDAISEFHYPLRLRTAFRRFPSNIIVLVIFIPLLIGFFIALFIRKDKSLNRSDEPSIIALSVLIVILLLPVPMWPYIIRVVMVYYYKLHSIRNPGSDLPVRERATPIVALVTYIVLLLCISTALGLTFYIARPFNVAIIPAALLTVTVGLQMIGYVGMYFFVDRYVRSGRGSSPHPSAHWTPEFNQQEALRNRNKTFFRIPSWYRPCHAPW